jgi:hypothetical protein
LATFHSFFLQLFFENANLRLQLGFMKYEINEGDRLGTELTASITKRAQPGFRASELLCLAVSLLLKVVPLLQYLVEVRLPTDTASMFRGQAIECGA